MLLIASCAFAQSDLNNQVRKGLYFSAGYTFGHVTLNDHYNDRESDMTYNGWLVSFFDVRLGGHITGIFSVYGTLGIGVGTGSYEHEYKGDDLKDDATNLKGILGVGTEITPFQNKENPLYGLFFGICGGLAGERVEYNYEGNEIGIMYHSDSDVAEHDIFDNFFGRIEVGYEWWVGSRWRFGSAFNYTFGAYDDGNWESITSHTFGLTLRFSR